MEDIHNIRYNVFNDNNLNNIINKYHKIMNQFVLKELLCNIDTPMRRYSLANDISTGFSLYVIGNNSNEHREAISQLTYDHFKNHLTILINIILDSNNEEDFSNSIFEWFTLIFSEWIYSLTLNYDDKIEGAKKFLIHLLENTLLSIRDVNDQNNANINTSNSSIQIIPEYVSYFVDLACTFHSNALQKHQSSSDEQQWMYQLSGLERQRWLNIIQTDTKKIPTITSEMRNHHFSETYSPSSSTKNSKISNNAVMDGKKQELNDELDQD